MDPPRLLSGVDDSKRRTSSILSIKQATGNPGDVKPVGEGIFELRIDYVPVRCRMTPLRRAKMKTRLRTSSSESLTRSLQGRQLSHAIIDDKRRLTLHFSGGATLVVEAASGDLNASIEQANSSLPSGSGAKQPTKRQFEYLSFIAKYISHFGRAPAERDIEQHFLVSAPSVNQMMQMLQLQGFITREPGVPRSARICIDLDAVSPSKGVG